ncbi:DUF305 domain-containing protein [Modestobacter sp. KNN46-3]|jgi:uncharacterized protein (DUF305 family)|uniref:DUF305 domain-containing protein n=1 Tax=Modestobacter sp. KNN46-3 TaxID=2711218 RepID=UPI0013DF79C8|nr:DUF305 domain-containing protein [Modestobacter sp. KNN46-3]
MTRTTARLARLTGGLIAGAVVLTGCAGEDGSAADAGSATAQAEGFNDADVAFAQGMIPHHEGALTMAEVAVDRAEDPRVRDLAERIEAGQEPEIDLMTGWLEEWGQPVEPDSMDGMDHGGMDMDGMDMADMPPAGADFDRMWLQSMIEHHDGAVVMAGTEIDEGQDDEAVDLARAIAETQTQEIEEMQRLLDELGG